MHRKIEIISIIVFLVWAILFIFSWLIADNLKNPLILFFSGVMIYFVFSLIVPPPNIITLSDGKRIYIEDERIKALYKAKKFLKPYKNPMGELTVFNNYCIVSISFRFKHEKQIKCIDMCNIDLGRYIKAYCNKYSKYDYVRLPNYIDYIYNIILNNFNKETRFENILNMLNEAKFEVKEFSQYKMININNATEEELLSVPGINLIQAKKAVNYISEHGNFNSLKDFIEFLKIKSNFVKQIENYLYVDIISKEEILNSEREVDL